jgi:DNA-binding FadR family transcriptional regulator
LIADEEGAIDEPEAFGQANAQFHEQLVALAGNQTLTIVAEMLNEVVARAVTIVSQADTSGESSATRRRGVRSQIRLLELIEAGDEAGAEGHWRTHMGVVGKVMLGQRAKTVIDLLDHQ